MTASSASPAVQVPALTEKEADVLWAKLTAYTDLFKFYMGLLLKANLGFYAITAALLAFYLAWEPSQMKGAFALCLLLPMAFSAGLALISVYSYSRVKQMADAIHGIQRALKAPQVPHVEVLVLFVALSAALFLLTFVAAGGLLAAKLAS